jgi:hypothetical protein
MARGKSVKDFERPEFFFLLLKRENETPHRTTTRNTKSIREKEESSGTKEHVKETTVGVL